VERFAWALVRRVCCVDGNRTHIFSIHFCLATKIMLLNAIVLFVFVAVVTSTVAADISGYWSKQDLNKIATTARTIAQTSLSSREIHHALQLLKNIPSESNGCSCDNVSAAAKFSKNAQDWYFAMDNSVVCGCNNVEIPKVIFDELENSLEVCLCNFVL
jgi:hypothetical protein